MNITHIGLVGYGEVGKIFSAGLRVQPGVASVAAWDLKLADPAHRDDLQKLARRYDVTDHVVFTGGVPGDELPAHHAMADVFAMPCRTRGNGLDVEGLGIVFLEASACGVPVVAGDSGGAPETVVEGETGHVVDGRDVAEIAAAGFDVIGISPDGVEKLAKFRAQEDLGFPLLADPDKAVLGAYGAFGRKMLYGKEIEGVIRSTFVVSVDDAGVGHVDVAQYNVKATGHVAKLRRELKIPDLAG